jgi:hypothetical protein
MTLCWLAQSVPKAGNATHENEDRCQGRSLDEGSRLRIAVADGATESIFAGEWAEALVESWCDGGDLEATVLGKARDHWRRSLPREEQLPWYALAKLGNGSHATAAFLEVTEAEEGVSWAASVVGDCVVFIRRSKDRLTVPSEPRFDSFPALLATTASAPARLVVKAGRTTRLLDIWIATDALASALIARRRHPRWSEWERALGDPSRFAALVEAWRHRGMLRNDDVTLARVWVT